MSKGYVYILTNPSMPCVVKIGKTTRTPQQRCDELWNTGVPTPFQVFCAVYSPDCHALERDMHILLRSLRVSHSREFFHISPSEAEEELKHLHIKQVEHLVAEFLPSHRPVHESIALDDQQLVEMAERMGVSAADVVRAVPHLEPGSLNAALHDYWRSIGHRD